MSTKQLIDKAIRALETGQPTLAALYMNRATRKEATP